MIAESKRIEAAMAKLIITIMTVALLMGADRTIRNVLMSVTHFFSAD